MKPSTSIIERAKRFISRAMAAQVTFTIDTSGTEDLQPKATDPRLPLPVVGKVRYKKTIHLLCTGTVSAEVHSHDGRLVGSEIFQNWFFVSREKRLIKAHKWADETIEMCLQYECMGGQVL